MTSTDPIQVFQAAVEAVRQEDWNGAATLCDPVTLRAFKRQMVEHLVPETPRQELTVEMLLTHEPSMPRAVAEYQIAQRQQFAPSESRLHAEFPGVPSIEALRELDPEKVFAAWLYGSSPRRQFERYARAGQPVPDTTSLAEMVKQHLYNFVSLGVVYDGPNVAHVVFRRRVEEMDLQTPPWAEGMERLPADEQEMQREMWMRTHPQLARLRRQPNGSWGMTADHSFFSSGINIGGFHPNIVSAEK